MPKLRWRRYWWEKVADVAVQEWMNEGNEGKLLKNIFLYFLILPAWGSCTK